MIIKDWKRKNKQIITRFKTYQDEYDSIADIGSSSFRP